MGANRKEIEDALWAGDIERLQELAPCVCCCHEHTFRDCPARQWEGCRGQGGEQYEAGPWAAFYEKTRGMTLEEFYGYELQRDSANTESSTESGGTQNEGDVK